MIPKMILTDECSQCHGARQIVVRSREGGFVTKNCMQCGQPRRVGQAELPVLDCPLCGEPMKAEVRYHNYYYGCAACGHGFQLWAHVPWWHELFEEHGIGLPTIQPLAAPRYEKGLVEC